jgi:hypothetical protein
MKNLDPKAERQYEILRKAERVNVNNRNTQTPVRKLVNQAIQSDTVGGGGAGGRSTLQKHRLSKPSDTHDMEEEKIPFSTIRK